MSRTLTNYLGVEVPDLTDPQPAASGQISGRVGGNDLASAFDEHDHTLGKGLPVVPPAPVPSSQGHLEGLRITYATASTVDIAAGIARDSGNTFDIDAPAPLTADIAAAGANGLDVGFEAADAWYAVHVIADTTAVEPTASLLSLSATSPTLPAGYDATRRVGWVRNDAGSNFLEFHTFGMLRRRTFVWRNQQALPTLTSDGSLDCSAGVPETAVRGMFIVQFSTAFVGNGVRFGPDGTTNDFKTIDLRALVAGTFNLSDVEIDLVDGTQAIRFDEVGSDVTLTTISVGYHDEI